MMASGKNMAEYMEKHGKILFLALLTSFLHRRRYAHCMCQPLYPRLCCIKTQETLVLNNC